MRFQPAAGGTRRRWGMCAAALAVCLAATAARGEAPRDDRLAVAERLVQPELAFDGLFRADFRVLAEVEAPKYYFVR